MSIGSSLLPHQPLASTRLRKAMITMDSPRSGLNPGTFVGINQQGSEITGASCTVVVTARLVSQRHWARDAGDGRELGQIPQN